MGLFVSMYWKVLIEGTMNGKMYQDILDKSAASCWDGHFSKTMTPNTQPRNVPGGFRDLKKKKNSGAKKD